MRNLITYIYKHNNIMYYKRSRLNIRFLLIQRAHDDDGFIMWSM